MHEKALSIQTTINKSNRSKLTSNKWHSFMKKFAIKYAREHRFFNVSVNLKKRISYSTFLWWTSFDFHIKNSTNLIIVAHDAILQQIESNIFNIYIDENDFNDRIDAVAVISSHNINCQAHMSIEKISIVYAEEFQSIIMILEKTKKCEIMMIVQKVNIFTNNQTFIQIFNFSKIQSGQYIIKQIIYFVNSPKNDNKNFNYQLHWISAHAKISNNEATDKTIKKTTKTEITFFNVLQFLILTAKMKINKQINKKWHTA